MLVKNWMTKKVVTIGEDESMQTAMTLMKENNVRMLPVVTKGKLVGVVSDTDLKRSSASDATLLDVHELLYLLSKIKVRDIMSKKPVTVPENYTVEETAEVLTQNKISGVPVVNDAGAVVGIITKADLFDVLMTLSGFGKKGIQFAFLIEDKPGSIKCLTDVFRSHNGRIASILGTYENAPEGFRIVYIRVYDLERAEMQGLMEELRSKGSLIYYVDHRNNKREILMDLRA